MSLSRSDVAGATTLLPARGWRVLWLIVVATAVAATGCGFSPAARFSPLDGGRSSDDGGALDLASPSDHAVRGERFGEDDASEPAAETSPGPKPCGAGVACPAGEVCFGGTCQSDPCAQPGGTACGDGKACRALCVPVVDPCAGVTCPGGQTCVEGSCVPGCFHIPCAGVICAAGQHCDGSSGKCVTTNACSGTCAAGNACHRTCVAVAPVANPCATVICPAGQVCAGGRCVSDPCAGVVCAAGSACNGGTCVDSCACSAGCGSNGRCIEGKCSCTPTCPADGSRAGQSDGCNGTCACPAGTRQYNQTCC
ncbi:MAG TPA: hypothetical protein VFH73_03460, partial [Polyangia bacterium]|nr:hypothetical protein [Polyangia bacterium]